MKQKIVIRLQKEGIHRWKDCPHEDVAFLREYHRHIFHFEVKMLVTHEDRELEFIRLKRTLEDMVMDILEGPVDASCEKLCQKLYNFLQSAKYLFQNFPLENREVVISCFEDGENGAEVIF